MQYNVVIRRGLAAARRSRRPPAAGLAAAHGPLGAGGADRLDPARHRRAGGRARVPGEPDRGDVRVRDALGGGGGAGAALAGAGPRGPARSPEPARARSGAVPVPRPRRAGRGDPGRRRAAVAAARVLDHPGTRRVSGRRPPAGARVRRLAATLQASRNRHRLIRGPLIALVAGLCALVVAASGGAGTALAHTAQAPVRVAAPASRSPSLTGVKKAPSGPPLGTGTGAAANGQEEASASAQPSGGDPLAGNGLDSPLCGDAAEDGLPGSAARDCRISGFEGAQAPTGNYAFDVHINDGLAHLGNGMAVLLQDVSQYWWTAQVAFVRGLIVILDWCFTVDLLSSHAMSGLARALRATQATFTQPWLALVLAIAAVLALYHGLIRRRVAETLGEALLMMAMMAGGLWVIVNPAGTVGALGAWANEASLGTLAATVGGSPDHP